MGIDAEYFPETFPCQNSGAGSLTTSRGKWLPICPGKQSRIKTNKGFMDVLIPVSPTL